MTTHIIRQCFCGCDTFRFLLQDIDLPVTQNICKNCKHSLAEHINTTRSKQAE